VGVEGVDHRGDAVGVGGEDRDLAGGFGFGGCLGVRLGPVGGGLDGDDLLAGPERRRVERGAEREGVPAASGLVALGQVALELRGGEPVGLRVVLRVGEVGDESRAHDSRLSAARASSSSCSVQW
jgi:hypothetical protein